MGTQKPADLGRRLPGAERDGAHAEYPGSAAYSGGILLRQDERGGMDEDLEERGLVPSAFLASSASSASNTAREPISACSQAFPAIPQRMAVIRRFP